MTSHTHPAIALVLGAAAIGAAWMGVDPGSDTPASLGLYAHVSPADGSSASPHSAFADSNDEIIERYCVRCHSDQRLRGNLTLEAFSMAEAPAQGEIAEKMIRKLRAGMMPPPGARRPSVDSLLALVEALENRMDQHAAANPNPGSRPFQRLNRAEYQTAVRELLGVEVDVGAYLPPDTKSANFDNIADVQVPSATLMEGYLRAANAVSQAALGDPLAGPTSTPYTVPRTASQKERVEGAPFGTRGGVAVLHTFPADGKYVFRVMPYAAPEGELFGRTQMGEQIEISIDGERVAVLDLDRWMSESDPNGMTLTTDSIHVRAGQRRVAAAFVKRFDGPVDDLMRAVDHTLADTQIGLDYGVTTLPHLQRFTVTGPYDVTGISETPTRAAVFTCRPTSPAEGRPCAERIVTRIASQAYRRPLTDGDVDDLMAFYAQGEEEGGFERGVSLAVQAVLASPHFVFRTEQLPGGVNAEAEDAYRISDLALASRLSFFLWGSAPDAPLVAHAERGALADPETLRSEVRRMLADERAGALASRFAVQWLRLGDLEKVHPDALDYPAYDNTLADAMYRETELLFDHIVREDAPVLDLITADYTFVNERLARHYGIPNVTGEEFRKVEYPGDARRGLLGHGSILTQTSHANRTSPVLRGKWVMEVLMGAPPPPPPPDVPELEATAEAEEGRVLSVRERMEQHRANPTCNSCHRFIDPIGLALENFDVTGAWRVKDEGNPVDPVGELYDGTELRGPADLRDALMKRPEVFLRTFTENLMSYALGRRVEYFDQPTVRQITAAARDNDYRLSSFVLGVVESPAFQMSRTQMMTEEDGVDPQSGEAR